MRADIFRVVRVVRFDQGRAEELVRVEHRARPARRRPVVQHEGSVGIAVGLRRQQPEVVVALAELVDQVLAVDAVGRRRVRGADVVADGGQREHQRRQPLLPVHDQPALHTTGLQRGARGEHD